MKLIIIVVLLAIIGGYFYQQSRMGPAQTAGQIIDEARDKTQRIMDIVKE